MANGYFVKTRPDGRFDVKFANADRASAVVGKQEDGVVNARELSPPAAFHPERVRIAGAGRDRWRKI